jgi:diaminopimelate epimerase
MGTNVDFVQIIDDDNIKIRTYERGVEDETLACGTGTVAAALITSYRLMATGCRKLNVYTKSGEVLRVEFNKIDNKFKDVWLAGKARVVYRGVFCA